MTFRLYLFAESLKTIFTFSMEDHVEKAESNVLLRPSSSHIILESLLQGQMPTY